MRYHCEVLILHVLACTGLHVRGNGKMLHYFYSDKGNALFIAGDRQQNVSKLILSSGCSNVLAITGKKLSHLTF